MQEIINGCSGCCNCCEDVAQTASCTQAESGQKKQSTESWKDDVKRNKRKLQMHLLLFYKERELCLCLGSNLANNEDSAVELKKLKKEMKRIEVALLGVVDLRCSSLLGFVTTVGLVLVTVLMVDSITFGHEMVNILVSGEEYDIVFNHLDMLNAPFEVKVFTCAKQVKPYVWISQKSQENSQKRANMDTRIRRVQKEAKDPKP
ncbi:hypothetical protein Tco_1121130 [Tanacetum coccineum]|uniref:Uncharacterized protein n=1 Tax=Tanacetum coccineum TaxID=301880 RepID=A0ABQ5IYC5_9ASTR